MFRFVISASVYTQYPHHTYPEFALIGPSNAGKSTLINALANKSIALVSKKPGKTRTLNFYEFDKYYLVDMPGYGYAKGSKTSVNSLLNIIDEYFSNREIIYGALQVCSCRELSDIDLSIVEYLKSRFHNYVLLINKIDKLSSLMQSKLLKSVMIKTNLPQESIFFISGKEKINIVMVKKKIESWLK